MLALNLKRVNEINVSTVPAGDTWEFHSVDEEHVLECGYDAAMQFFIVRETNEDGDNAVEEHMFPADKVIVQTKVYEDA